MVFGFGATGPPRYFSQSMPDGTPAWRGMKPAILSGSLGLLFLSLTASVVIAWVGFERALHPACPPYEWNLACALPTKPFSMAGFSGGRRSLVILASGYGDTQDQMLPIAEFLHQAGFNVLTCNSRARAPSGGEYVTLGVMEQRDLLSVVDYAAARADVDSNRIGAPGISMGASTAILSAARDKRINAVVDDSSRNPAMERRGEPASFRRPVLDKRRTDPSCTDPPA